jgi:hypothetical protein
MLDAGNYLVPCHSPLPDDMLKRYRRGAAVAGKHLDEFLMTGWLS